MDGILPLHKPQGMTSHDCVAKVRRILKTKKVGHTGTLDPDVSGVLPLCIGRATKIVQYMTNATKTYEAEIKLGFSTTTEDASGDMVEEKVLDKRIDRKEVLHTLEQFTGEIEQTPPMYSAVKVKGKRLYEYAREGITVERPTRTVTIHEMELLEPFECIDEKKPTFRIKVICSKGTYIRTLAVDIGKALGYPSHMSHLIRTAAGSFSIEECLTFAEIENQVESDTLHLFPLEDALSGLKKYIVTDEMKAKILNGAVLSQPTELKLDARLAMFDQEGNCLAIYQKHPKKAGLIKPEKVLHT